MVEQRQLYCPTPPFPPPPEQAEQNEAEANSPQGITVIAHLAQIDQTINVKSRPIFSNTFAEAPEYNLQLEKEVDESGLMRSFYGGDLRDWCGCYGRRS